MAEKKNEKSEKKKIGTGNVRCIVKAGKFMGAKPGSIVWLTKHQLGNFGDVIKVYSEATEAADKVARQEREIMEQDKDSIEEDLVETAETANAGDKAAARATA